VGSIGDKQKNATRKKTFFARSNPPPIKNFLRESKDSKADEFADEILNKLVQNFGATIRAKTLSIKKDNLLEVVSSLIQHLLGWDRSQERNEVFGLLPTFEAILSFMKSEALKAKVKRLSFVSKKVKVTIDPKVF
jgi:hypothetical protein